MNATREWLRRHGLTARLLSYAKTWPQICDGSKTVTRRRSTVLKRGDLVEPIEWSPRLAERFCCAVCGELLNACHCSREKLGDLWEPGARAPRRGPLQIVTSVRPELLGDITASDVAKEGFPGMTVGSFIRVYLAGEDKPQSDWAFLQACNLKVFRIETLPIPLSDEGSAIIKRIRS